MRINIFAIMDREGPKHQHARLQSQGPGRVKGGKGRKGKHWN